MTTELQQAVSGELDSIRGLAAQVTELDMIISPEGPNAGLLVCVVKHYGQHVCWGCMEPFGQAYTPTGPAEITPHGGTVPVLLHRKCVDPKNRKIFSDMKGSTRLQTVEEVSKGFRVRKAMAAAVRPFVEATKNAGRIILTGE